MTDLNLRMDKYVVLGAYRDAIDRARKAGIGGKTIFGTVVTLKFINTMRRRYEELQIRWKVYGRFDT
tara:strand:+ start:652 stop:852 length:201 start_codon:yes stop_codon:yes gene_type:complete